MELVSYFLVQCVLINKQLLKLIGWGSVPPEEGISLFDIMPTVHPAPFSKSRGTAFVEGKDGRIVNMTVHIYLTPRCRKIKLSLYDVMG
jgi:hypothetical protein